MFSLFDRVVARDLQGCLETLTTLLLARRGDAIQIVAGLANRALAILRTVTMPDNARWTVLPLDLELRYNPPPLLK